ncbi:hypothetical protein RJT34_31986 [Clitoria ternatea]|uniref:Uncharacterized protein n=1 Tax=Clitoria ternatea TaxID=43366 RepID=A0AAN9EV70_CLITE
MLIVDEGNDEWLSECCVGKINDGLDLVAIREALVMEGSHDAKAVLIGDNMVLLKSDKWHENNYGEKELIAMLNEGIGLDNALSQCDTNPFIVFNSSGPLLGSDTLRLREDKIRNDDA